MEEGGLENLYALHRWENDHFEQLVVVMATFIAGLFKKL